MQVKNQSVVSVASFGFACLTGLLAQLKFYLPFTPVPVTGQVFGVLLSGVVLGRWYGGMSQGIYAGLGALGMPWFAGLNGGIEVLTGVTGGYIIGFVAASLIIGWFAEGHGRSFKRTLILMLIGIAVIYLFGVVQLSLVMGVGMQKAIELGALPFIAVDVYKALIAATIATAITPKNVSS